MRFFRSRQGSLSAVELLHALRLKLLFKQASSVVQQTTQTLHIYSQSEPEAGCCVSLADVAQ